MAELKIGFNEDGSVGGILSGAASMDVFFEDGTYLFTVPVFGARLHRAVLDGDQEVNRFHVDQEPNAIGYRLTKDTQVEHDPDEGSVSFMSGNRKYKIRPVKDSDGFDEYFEYFQT